MTRGSTALVIRKDASGERLCAARPYRTGETVVDFRVVEWRPQRDRETVQHPAGGHIYHPLLSRVAHACEPNSWIVMTGRALVAVRPIAPGEPITYDYTTTESRFARPFICGCGGRRCRGRIG